MDNQQIIEALTALVTGIQNQQNAQALQHQEHQAALVLQQGQQQAAMAAQQLAQQNRHDALLQHLQGNNNVQGPRATTLATIPNYSGSPEDDLVDWEATLYRAAEVDDWDEAMLRRVAISKLTRTALTWQGQTGHALMTWDDWIGGLRALFSPQLSLPEWILKVEGRRQAQSETGAQYAIDKAKLCRRCPVPIAEQDIIPYLVRGLNRPDQAAALLGNMPVTVEDFVTRIRDIEQVGYSSLSTTVATPNPPNNETADYIKALTAQVASLTATVQSLTLRPRYPQNFRPYQTGGNQVNQQGMSTFRPATPTPFRPGTPTFQSSGNAGQQTAFTPRPAQAYIPRQRAPLSEQKCWTCNNFGHLSRDCPTRISASSFFSGNEEADLQGQGWPTEQ